MNQRTRVALCISGQPRFFEAAFPYIKRNIIDCNPNVDIFLHAWHNPGEEFTQTSDTGAKGATSGRTQDETTPARLHELYNPVVASFEQQEDFTDRIKPVYMEKRDKTNPFATFSMWTSIKRCNALKQEYERKNGFVYDYVIRHRYDCVYTKPILVTNLATNALHVHGEHTDAPGVCDVSFISSSKNMDVITSLVDQLEPLFANMTVWNNELFLGNHVRKNSIQLQPHWWNPILIRRSNTSLSILEKQLEYALGHLARTLSPVTRFVRRLRKKIVL